MIRCVKAAHTCHLLGVQTSPDSEKHNMLSFAGITQKMKSLEFSFIFFILVPHTISFGRCHDISFSICWMDNNHVLERKEGKVTSLTVPPGVKNKLTLQYGGNVEAWTLRINQRTKFTEIRGRQKPQKKPTSATKGFLAMLSTTDVFACENSTLFLYQDDHFFLAIGHTMRFPIQLESRSTSMLLFSWMENPPSSSSFTVNLYHSELGSYNTLSRDTTTDNHYRFTALESCSNYLSFFLLTTFHLDGLNHVTEEVLSMHNENDFVFMLSNLEPCGRVRFGFQTVCQKGIESRYSKMVLNDGNSESTTRGLQGSTLSTSFTVGGLLPCQQYEARVEAMCGDGVLMSSETITAHTAVAFLYELTLENGTTIQSSRITDTELSLFGLEEGKKYLLERYVCPSDSLCINTFGSYTCVCKHEHYDVSSVSEPLPTSNPLCVEKGLFSQCLNKLVIGAIAKPFLKSSLGGKVDVRLNDGSCAMEENEMFYYFRIPRKTSDCGTERRLGLTMTLFTDESYTSKYIHAVTIEPEDNLFLQVALQSENSFAADVLLQVESCWATESTDPQDNIQGFILQDGMPRGLPLYIHCLANICGPHEDCTKSCSSEQRSKRSASQKRRDGNRAGIVSAGADHMTMIAIVAGSIGFLGVTVLTMSATKAVMTYFERLRQQ
ncbi:hypothetical protein F7725_022042 [Dissostichus mawsoni]|uniref:ZP-C domain-containing protein n=1 Tax=Dissostichus mawsoni TaxID=36200 RepID=A0A7J5ZDH9_DISMA|nr:hypothetical protein F7725_022042 [Dissostichus mawsoni]